MARITDATTEWSAGTTVSEKEMWYVHGGGIWLTMESSPEEQDGVPLRPGDFYPIPSGKTVKYMLMHGNGFADIRREPVG